MVNSQWSMILLIEKLLNPGRKQTKEDKKDKTGQIRQKGTKPDK
jgi:hypothetical protein